MTENDDLEAFRTFVGERLGLRCGDGDVGRFADALGRRMAESGAADYAAYARRLACDRGELRALSTLITIGETSFFRNADNLRVLTDIELPERLESGRPLRILSAGCASGEEAYSIAIAIRETQKLAGAAVTIVGIDVHPGAIERARRARYSSWSLRDTPDATRERYFRSAGREHQLADAVRALAAFEERNLLDEDPDFWAPDAFDAVFFRNVLMYFTPAAAERIVARITRSLAPGGSLFLGYAENLRGIDGDLRLRHSNETFYYVRRSADAPPAPAAVPLGARPDVAGRSAARVTCVTGPAAPLGPDLSRGLELLQSERFADVSRFLEALPAPVRGAPDAQLLLAVLLTNDGRFGEAEEVCRRLVALDDPCAGAHYLLALVRDHEGGADAAAVHDQTAIDLDSTFAMPHLHLGLLARRRGDAASARRSIGHALHLLACEHPARIVLYGGGLSRAALVELCRGELGAGASR